MKNSLTFLCRHPWTAALLTGFGVGWAMTEAINLGVGVAIGVGVAASLLARSSRD